MPVKHWSRAGLLLSWWCNARCPSCYLSCRPGPAAWAPIESLLDWWAQLIAASPHGCRVHLTGGEPFGNFPLLLELCQRAQRRRLGPLEKIETNAFWAEHEARTADWIGRLDRAGMQRLSISADPYHQQFVPIDRPRRAARIAAELLGPRRVQVRWADWLADGRNTEGLSPRELVDLAGRFESFGRDRHNGRGAEQLAGAVPLKPISALVDRPCSAVLLRGKHVHISPEGLVMPGTCAGILLGRIEPGRSVGQIWRQLDTDHEDRPIVSALARRGPAGLLDRARRSGFAPADGYASRCHLCWQLRKHLAVAGLGGPELGPGRIYEPATT